MKCPDCGEILEESDFDSKIGICPNCGNSWKGESRKAAKRKHKEANKNVRMQA